MNLSQKVDQLFATSSRAQIDELLKKANFEHFNAVGCDILSPEQAVARAEELRNTFESVMIPEFTPASKAHVWSLGANDLSAETLFTSDGFHYQQISSLYASPLDLAGKTEEAPLAA